MTRWLILILLGVPAVVFGQIEPSQVLVVGNGRNPDSMRLAKIYARARGIAPRNILRLDVPDGEEISRRDYARDVADPIRRFLRQLKLEDKIKVVVTLYGLPIRVGSAASDASPPEMIRQVRTQLFAAFEVLETAYRDLEKMAGVATTQPTTLPGRDSIEKFLPRLTQIVEKTRNLYRQTISRLQSLPDRAEQERGVNQFMQLRVLLEGRMALAAMARDSAGSSAAIAREVQEKETAFLKLLATVPEKRDLTLTYRSARELGGLFLELKTLYEDYCRLIRKDSESALDSELCLVLWNDYPLAGRLPNPLNPRFTGHPTVTGLGPTLMVSRLDGPDPATVERIIVDSVSAEKTGLSGTVYIDARGIKTADGFFLYDQNLRDLGALVQKRTALRVVLDDRPELFPPGSSPDAGLYCGWYSLKTYVPAFTFVPGAVGYHIASFEAITLKQKASNQWVKRLLENGICATLGPVAEPYLDAFPLPSEFFGLLLTGKYTLAEVYFRTNRYNSWRMMLIGDPLYRPFAKNPMLEESDVELKPLNMLFVE